MTLAQALIVRLWKERNTVCPVYVKLNRLTFLRRVLVYKSVCANKP